MDGNLCSEEREKSIEATWFVKSRIASVSICHVMDAIKSNAIKLPIFQRDAVWEESRVCALWDSLLREFPLPSFLLAKPHGNSRDISISSERTVTNVNAQIGYLDLIDGQQRISAIQNGFTLGKNLRLWIDLDPPKEAHPFQFEYWVHPCTSKFPFGFNMRKSGEVDFNHLSDADMRAIWPQLQKNSATNGRELFEIPLNKSFPWKANCPIPLDTLLEKICSSTFCLEELETIIREIAQNERTAQEEFRLPSNPDVLVVKKIAKAFFKLKDYHLALQLLVAGGDNFTLFERIGRGGVQISQRQMAVSHLMQEIGESANNSVAEFQGGKWKDILDTEDIIRSIVRISNSKISNPISQNYSEQSGWEAISKWDMFDLDLTRIRRIKVDESERWKNLITEMQANCKTLNIHFNVVFDNVLRYSKLSNDKGISLIQLAQTSQEGGIQPITLHPLLYWEYYIKNNQISNNDLLKWIIFSNGIVSDPAHRKLNQLAFHKTVYENKFCYDDVIQEVFKVFSHSEREELGFDWKVTSVLPSGDPSQLEITNAQKIPEPSSLIRRTLGRIILDNWADQSGLNPFLLMWNQRNMLEGVYGKTLPQHIHALYGKGRPIDADHIVARAFFKNNTGSVLEADVRDAVTIFLDGTHYNKHIRLTAETFRLHLSNLNGNYRYWPLYLNRADQASSVDQKMPIKEILSKLKFHGRLSTAFTHPPPDEEIGWPWSCVREAEWKNLPPSDNKWKQADILKFISAIIMREYYLYSSAYDFLTNSSTSTTAVNLSRIIK